MIDEQTLALMTTIATASAGSAIYIGKIIRAVEVNLSAKLTAHEAEDRRIFQEHGLRMQRLELREFGWTGAGKEVFEHQPPD